MWISTRVGAVCRGQVSKQAPPPVCSSRSSPVGPGKEKLYFFVFSLLRSKAVSFEWRLSRTLGAFSHGQRRLPPWRRHNVVLQLPQRGCNVRFRPAARPFPLAALAAPWPPLSRPSAGAERRKSSPAPPHPPFSLATPPCPSPRRSAPTRSPPLPTPARPTPSQPARRRAAGGAHPR